MAAVGERARLEGAGPVDVDEVVLRVVGRCARPSGVQVDVSGVSGGQVLGIEDDLERMIENLVSNAVRHATTSVEITVAERRGEVLLTVGDDGPGIPPERREQVFERFTRIDGARSRDRGGAGLGLAIARAIAHAHAGSIGVGQSATGGALFVVTLPASVVEAGERHTVQART
jgi:signal transduction histidine kinase